MKEKSMRKKIVSALLIGTLLALPALAHDLFLKPDSFFAKVNSKVTISILNGSFLASEGAVNFARLQDVSVVAPSGSRTNPKEADFTKNETTSFLHLEPKEPGNYVVGLSTMPREIDLAGKDFNEYLEHDGIPDVLDARKRNKELDKAVREKYSKHVKTIFQVGETQSDSYKTVLGYPVEIVPQANPYKLKAGDSLDVLCLKGGKPLVNQFVMSGHEADGKVIAGQNVRTDKQGIARIRIERAGKWYVRFIEMSKLNDAKLDYESKWATLTFEIR